MKFTFLLLSFLPFFSFLSSQPLNPVTWTFTAEKISEEEYNLKMTATLKKGWFIYSQHLEDGGPVPTSLRFRDSDTFSLIGFTEETGNKKEGFDDLFGINVVKYSGKATFTQRVKITGNIETIDGFIEFMTCDDERCLPPKEMAFAFSFQK